MDRPSRRKLKGRHVILNAGRNLTELERLALQSMLQSDPIRELLGYGRLIRGTQYPVLFFESEPIQGKETICIQKKE